MYAERKFSRLERLLDDRTDAIVELSNEAHRSAADAHIVDVTLVIDGHTLRSRATGGSYQAALDVVVDKVERQTIDYKEKPRVHARPEEKALLRHIADGTAETAVERQIVKTKRFAIEPMFEEDAVAAMEELRTRFYVFAVNAEHERVCVLYRRKDGNYGLIEPMVAGDYTQDRRGSGLEERPPLTAGGRAAQDAALGDVSGRGLHLR